MAATQNENEFENVDQNYLTELAYETGAQQVEVDDDGDLLLYGEEEDQGVGIMLEDEAMIGVYSRDGEALDETYREPVEKVVETALESSKSDQRF